MTPFIGKAKEHNNHMHSDSKKRRSFLALLFAAGDVKRWRRQGAMASLRSARAQIINKGKYT